MAPNSYIRIRDAGTGALRALFTATNSDGDDVANTGFLSVVWRRRVNDVDTCSMVVSAANPDRQYLIDKNILEIWRSDPAIGLAEYKAFAGEIRDDVLSTDKQNRNRMTVRAYGYNARLGRRIVAYPANKANYTTFASTPAETVMKRLVRDNCDTTFATTGNGRDRTPSFLNLTIATDAGVGNVINWSCGNRPNLLTELRKIATIAGGDFAVVNTAGDSAGPTFQFIFYAGQLGADRTTGSNPIIFSTDRGNMAAPTLARIRSVEKTVALVGGRGEDASRMIREVFGPNITTSNDIELFVDGRNAETAAQLDAIGAAAMQENKFRNVLEYDVLQTALYSVDKDYFLGDLVLARYAGVNITQQVYDITIEYEKQREHVAVVMRDR